MPRSHRMPKNFHGQKRTQVREKTVELVPSETAEDREPVARQAPVVAIVGVDFDFRFDPYRWRGEGRARVDYRAYVAGEYRDNSRIHPMT